MASKPRDLLVRFLADVAPFLRSTDQVEDAYRDMAADSDRLADLGEKDARRLAQAYDRAADEMKRDARETGKVTKAGFAETGKEAGQEFSANLGGAISSGDFTSVAQETAGGLAATFGAAGPVGIAFSLLTAAGVAAMTGISAAAEKARAAAQTAFDEIIDGANKETRLRNRLEEMFGTYEEGFTAIQKMSDETGISVAEIADALAEGGAPARELADEAERIAVELGKAPALGRAVAINPAAVGQARKLADHLNEAASATERAARAEQTRGQALRTSASYYNGAYAPGGSTYQSQVPTYERGRR